MKSLFERYDKFEDGLIDQFREHPFFAFMKTMTDAELIEYLLQVGHLSSFELRNPTRALFNKRAKPHEVGSWKHLGS